MDPLTLAYLGLVANVVIGGLALAATYYAARAARDSADAAKRSNDLASSALDAMKKANEIADHALATSKEANQLSAKALGSLNAANELTTRALAFEETRDKERRATVAARLSKVLGDVLDVLIAALAQIEQSGANSNIWQPAAAAFGLARTALLAERDRSENGVLDSALVAELAQVYISFDEAWDSYSSVSGGDDAARRQTAATALEPSTRSLHAFLVRLSPVAGAGASPIEPWDGVLAEKLGALRKA